MATLREWVDRLRGSLRGGRPDAELEEELRLHLELAAEDARQRDASSEDAARAAAIGSGGVAQAMEALRDQRGLPWLDDLARDVRHAARLLRRSPAFASVAVLSLALGIGATTAVFGAFSGLALRTVPVDHPETLVRLRWVGVNEMGADFNEYGYSEQLGGRRTRTTFSYPMFEVFRAHNHTLVDLLACAPKSRLNVVVNGRAESPPDSWPPGATSTCWACTRPQDEPSIRPTTGPARPRSLSSATDTGSAASAVTGPPSARSSR